MRDDLTIVDRCLTTRNSVQNVRVAVAGLYCEIGLSMMRTAGCRLASRNIWPFCVLAHDLPPTRVNRAD